MFRRFVQWVGLENSTLWLLAFAGLGMLYIASPAKADNRPIYCMQRAAAETEVTTDVTFSGPELVKGDWVVQHDTITIAFKGAPPLVWSASMMPHKQGVIMDWIDTALRYEKTDGYGTYAIRHDGQVWLGSQHKSEGNMHCFAHPLYPHILTPHEAIKKALEIQLNGAP